MNRLPAVALFLALGACISDHGLAQEGPENPARPSAASAERGALSRDNIEKAPLSPVTEKDGMSPSIVRIQVLLDRMHFSPGVIDGRHGENLQKAVAAFRTARSLEGSGDFDAAFAEALAPAAEMPVLMDYKITDEDTAYRFTPDLPTDYGKLAAMKNLNFQTMTEMLAERFHMDERLVLALNPKTDFLQSGSRIVVANVERSRLQGKVDHIEVDKQKGELRAFDRDGALLVAYPATIGSQDVPSPSGEHKVKGVAWKPRYTYDPVKNFKQGSNSKRLSIPSGPNNPVGSVFIALSKPTYGIHGTPEPSKIDKTVSHGCVRLTNWDAEELGHLVRGGTKVRFVE